MWCCRRSLDSVAAPAASLSRCLRSSCSTAWCILLAWRTKSLRLPLLAFARIGRQLHPVDGKHRAPNQALPIADHEHLREHLARRLTELAHKARQRAVIGLGI